jgi:hypothetical protein
MVRLWIAAIIVAAACSSESDATDDTVVLGTHDDFSTMGPGIGRYALRGTIEGNRQATGTLAVTAFEPGSAAYDSTRRRVRATYPTYTGPLYRAELVLVAGDSVRSTFTCANNPDPLPSLVCHPVAPIPQLRDAALVVQPDGRATLSGSHGEGVTVEYGRFSWERASGD